MESKQARSTYSNSSNPQQAPVKKNYIFKIIILGDCA